MGKDWESLSRSKKKEEAQKTLQMLKRQKEENQSTILQEFLKSIKNKTLRFSYQLKRTKK